MSEKTADQTAHLDALAGRLCSFARDSGPQGGAGRDGIESQLAAAVENLPPSDKIAALVGIAARLAVVAAQSTGAPESASPELKSKFQLSDGEPVDARRVQELAAVLGEFAMGIDRVVWGMWSKKLAPQSALRSAGPIQRFMKDHVVGSPSGTPIAGEVRRLLEMTVALVSSIGQAGASFGDKFISQYSPGSIEDAVGEGAFRNKDAECWKVYKARAASVDRAAIDAEVTQAIARFVEDWMKRTVRP